MLIQEERGYETMFALQVPEQVEVKQNARLEGPHDSQEKRNWQINDSIQGK